MLEHALATGTVVIVVMRADIIEQRVACIVLFAHGRFVRRFMVVVATRVIEAARGPVGVA